MIFLFFEVFIYNSLLSYLKQNKKYLHFSNTFYIQSFYILSNLFIDSVSPTSTTISVSLNLYSGSRVKYSPYRRYYYFYRNNIYVIFLRTDNSIMLLPIHVFGTTASIILYSSDNSDYIKQSVRNKFYCGFNACLLFGNYNIIRTDFFSTVLCILSFAFTDNLLNSHIF